MPLNIPPKLPAIEALKRENIFVMDMERASTQEIRPLRIAVLNLMPLKITTETDLIRLLSNSPLQIEIDFIRLKTHTSKNTPIKHLMEFYKDFDEIRVRKYDGLIVTGAPVETIAFEEVNYWPEVTGIFDWARHNVTSTLFICWAALAGLYHYYGIPKHDMPAKCFGVFPHVALDKKNPIFRGFDDEFYVPHSRYSQVLREDIEKVKGLKVIAESPVAGVYMVMARHGREFYVTGHPEYAPNTLGDEYLRDKAKGLDIAPPANYFRDDDPAKGPVVRWKSHANLLYTNWLNYFVYQETPYDINTIE